MADSGDMFGGEPPWETEVEPAKPSVAELEAAGQSALFGGPAEPVAAAPAPASPSAIAPQIAQPYRVLARKYRPRTFSELIGQEPMVRTLGNAIERERLAHAFLMTGVRGVGKTSTARLIAKALNCIGPDGQGGPTIDPCGVCEPCVAIAEGRHIDVIEMDAASHTGIDDMRQIIEAVRYSAVSARYKMYIIDEAHMLSKQAWNGLLKTLEEPPAHVKFLFATTEVEKVPITVLSRTQRFDLRRIPAPLLREHFASVCRQERVEAEDEALAMIAAAAEGSVRDGLSILDQAIAHADLGEGSEGKVTAERVRDMLGLADKSGQRRLFTALLEADPQSLLGEVERHHALGVDPLALIRSQMELAHRIAVAQVGGSGADAPTLEERQQIDGWTDRLSAGQVHRLWQLLLKGHEEVKTAPDPLAAAQMALLRVLHAAELPDPGALAKQLTELAASGVGAPSSGASPGASSGVGAVAKIDWAELCDQVEQAGQLRVASVMRDWVRVIELVPGRLVFALAPGLSHDPAPELRDALRKVTGERWEVTIGEGDGDGSLSLRERAEAAKLDEAEQIRRDPLVAAALVAFPGAEIIADDDAPPLSERRWNKRA